MKRCSRCGVSKPESGFGVNTGRGGRQPDCTPCHIAHARQKMAELTPEQRAAYNDQRYRTRLKRKYGITAAAYDALLQGQGGVCAICQGARAAQGKRPLVVDHDHATGAVRGILCDYCNVALGRMGDDPARLEAAAAYLRRS